MEEKVGFWQGLGMVWTSLVMAAVKLCRSVEKGADVVLETTEAVHKGTQVMTVQVDGWYQEEMANNAKKLELLKAS